MSTDAVGLYDVEVEQTRRCTIQVEATDAIAAENIVDEIVRTGRLDHPDQSWIVDYEGIVQIGGRELPNLADRPKPGPPQPPHNPIPRHA